MKHANKGTELLEAVKNSNLEKVKELVKQADCNINYADDFGNTALHIAAQINAPDELIEVLLLAGINISQTNKSGKTALKIVLENTNIRISELLSAQYKPHRAIFIVAGYDTDCESFENKAKDIGAEIIVMDSDAEYKNKMDDLIKKIKSSLSNGDNEVKILFFVHGYESGHVMLDKNIATHRSQILQYLSANIFTGHERLSMEFMSCSSGAGLIRTDKSTKLATATDQQKISYARGNFNEESLKSTLFDGWQIAFNAGRFQTTQYINHLLIDTLLQNNQKSVFGYQLEKMFFPQTFKFFKRRKDNNWVEFKYDAPKPNFLQDTPKDQWLTKYQEHIIGKMKQFKDQYFQQDRFSISKRLEMEQEFKQAIYVINGQNQYGEVDKDATEESRQIIVEYINLDFLIACVDGNLEYVQFYLDHQQDWQNLGVDLDINLESSSDKKNLPLFFACEGGDFNVVKLLVQNKVNVNVKFENATPLFMACENNYFEIAKLLVENGAIIGEEERKIVHQKDRSCQGFTEKQIKELEKIAKNYSKTHPDSPSQSPCDPKVTKKPRHCVVQ